MPRRFLLFLGRLVVRHPGSILVFFGILAALSAWVCITELRMKTEQNELVGGDKEYNQRYLEFMRDFGDLEFIYAVIQVGDDPERAVAATESLARELTKLTNLGMSSPLVASFLHRIPASAMRYGIPLLTHEDLEGLTKWLRKYRGEIAAVAGASGFDELLGVFARVLRPSSLSEESDQGEDPVAGGAPANGLHHAEWGFHFLSVALSALEDMIQGRDPGRFRSAFEEELGLSLRERGYLATEKGGLILVEITPRSDFDQVEVIREPLAAIRGAVDRVRQEHPGVEMGLTGRPVLQADEIRTANEDMRFATAVALVGVLVLFMLFFRRLKRPFFSVLTLALSILITLGVVTVTIGYLTLLSVVFTAMLVGLGIDFGIHFVARYQDELLATRSVDKAIMNTLSTTGTSIGTGAVTTAAAFYTILLVDFKGLQELGFIAGTGVLICFLCMVTFLPALVLLVDSRSRRQGHFREPRPVRIPLVGFLASRGHVTLITAAVLTLVGLFSFAGLPYSSNLIELQSRKLESVKYEKLVIEESDFSTWYCAFVVENLENVRDTLRRLEPVQEAGIVSTTECVLDYLPPEEPVEGSQGRRLDLLRRASSALAGVEFTEPSREVELASLAESLEVLLNPLDDLSSLAIQREEVEAAGELDRLNRRIETIRASLDGLQASELPGLGTFQSRWFEELHAFLRELQAALEPREFLPRDLPFVLRRRLVSADGSRYLVYASPVKDIWDDRSMEEFVTAMREVDPRVTGAPIQVYESSWRMHKGFLLATIYAFCVTLVLLLVDLRSLRHALLAMVPLVVGLFWLLEVLPVLGLTFNLANFFALPILIGCGIDGGVHILHRFRESGSVKEVLQTTCSAVTLSFLTTMVGFGAMSVAAHRGIRSLGLMMVAGLGCVLLASVVVLPALLRLTRGKKLPEVPETIPVFRTEDEELERVTVVEAG